MYKQKNVIATICNPLPLMSFSQYTIYRSSYHILQISEHIYSIFTAVGCSLYLRKEGQIESASKCID